MTYVTTSRKASAITRRLAHSFSTIFGCLYETRGKASFNSVLARAESLGHTRIVFVHESHGNPHEIKAIQIGPDKTYDEIGSFVFHHILVERPRRISPYISYDRQSAKLVKLFLTKKELDKGTGSGRDAVDVFTEGNLVKATINGNEIIVLKKA